MREEWEIKCEWAGIWDGWMGQGEELWDRKYTYFFYLARNVLVNGWMFADSTIVVYLEWSLIPHINS